jgi:hypothetical protein
MYFQGHAAGFLKPKPNLSISEVWNIESHELSQHGMEVVKLLEAPESDLKSTYEYLVWYSQAILEFQDLQPVILPKSGPFLHANFLFFQSLEALRQAVLTGLNGQVSASFAVLRSALENFIFHYWWRSLNMNEQTFEKYYCWLENRPQTFRIPTFAQVMNEVLTSLDLPVGAVDLPTLKSVYAQLCSYVHKPLLAEALTTIRGGNVRGISIAEIEYWLDLMNRTQRVLLDIAIGYAPQALFPIEVHRKFGFKTPVGGFFDNSNFIPLQQALGEEVVNTYRTHFQGREPLAESLRWAQSHRDLSDDEILATWDGASDIDDDDQPIEQRLLNRCTQNKAHLRAQLFLFANAIIQHEFQDGDSEGTITIRQ